MSETTYNGWKNYPTWAVNLWLSNDERLYREALDKARRVTGETESRSKYWTLAESHRFTLSEILAGWVEYDLAPDLGASFAADLLGYALELVDWDEIADAWIETATDKAEDDGGGITPEGLALGHRYVMGNVNAYCPQCSDEQGVTVLDCDYDLDK